MGFRTARCEGARLVIPGRAYRHGPGTHSRDTGAGARLSVARARAREARLYQFQALAAEHKLLDRHVVAARVELRRVELDRHRAGEPPREGAAAVAIVDLDPHVLARRGGALAHGLGPSGESIVQAGAAQQRDRAIAGFPGDKLCGAGLAALAMRDQLGRLRKAAHMRDPGDQAAIPADVDAVA